MVLHVFWLAFWAALTALVIAAAIALRVRLRRRLGISDPRVDDDAVRSILETGVLRDDTPEPLDLDEIEEEERRFWSEPWDEPEEW